MTATMCRVNDSKIKKVNKQIVVLHGLTEEVE